MKTWTLVVIVALVLGWRIPQLIRMMRGRR
jgi:hypothetical protein